MNVQEYTNPTQLQYHLTQGKPCRDQVITTRLFLLVLFIHTRSYKGADAWWRDTRWAVEEKALVGNSYASRKHLRGWRAGRLHTLSIW